MQNHSLIRVVSFNLKRDFGVPLKSCHKWHERRTLAAQLIRETGATIIGVQELLPSMREDICKLLDVDYSVLGCGRFDGKKPHEDEHNDIIVKTQEANVKFTNTFWLSKKPEQTSRAYFSIFPRICTVAEVHLKQLNQTIRVFNTHLDHICGFSRLLGVKVILNHIKKYNQIDPLPTVLMGDFNCKPTSAPVRYLRRQLKEQPEIHLTDIYTLFDPAHLSNTLHGFSGKVRQGALPIDYIFVSDDFEVVDSKIVTNSINGRYPSDHYPILATLRLRESH